MQHLLRALCCASQLPLPVRLYKREAPDFVLETGNLRIGVETTEAINSDYVRAQMHPAAQKDGVVVDPSLYKWGNQGRPNSQIREEAGGSICQAMAGSETALSGSSGSRSLM